jgi:hypothetical protein
MRPVSSGRLFLLFLGVELQQEQLLRQEKVGDEGFRESVCLLKDAIGWGPAAFANGKSKAKISRPRPGVESVQKSKTSARYCRYAW